jgi:hypothetical protein
MSERDIASKVALSPIPYSVAKASLEDVLLYVPRNRKLVPENDKSVPARNPLHNA